MCACVFVMKCSEVKLEYLPATEQLPETITIGAEVGEEVRESNNLEFHRPYEIRGS